MTQPFLHYSCQRIEEDDIDAVVEVLRSDWLTQGPSIDRFEESITSYCGASYGVAVANATAGLHIACAALGVTEGDLVWTSPMSFVASANCARYLGAEVDFVDVEPDTGNMSVSALQTKLEAAQKKGRLPKVVIPVHYAGRACDMEGIHALKKRYGFKIIEDSAHALGAQYANGKPVGSYSESDATVFSFHPVKPITTGEGGMVITHHKSIADKVRLLRSHGMVRDAALLENASMPAWYWEQQSLGYNYRMTDFQAALGTSQMHKLDQFIAKRRELARRYAQLLQGTAVGLPPASDYSGWHLFVVQLGAKRDAVFKAMREAKIGVNVHYMPIYLHPYYRALGFAPGQFPQVEAFFAGCLSIPLHQGMSASDQERVVDTLLNAFR